MLHKELVGFTKMEFDTINKKTTLIQGNMAIVVKVVKTLSYKTVSYVAIAFFL